MEVVRTAKTESKTYAFGYVNVIVDLINEAQETTITKVLTAYLKRKPIDDDFKKCIKIIDEKNPHVFKLAYEATILGLITNSTSVDENKQSVISCEFSLIP